MRTKCCGAPVEALKPELAGAIAEERARELLEKASIVVTACPVCLTILEEPVRKLGGTVLDVIEVIDKALKHHSQVSP